MAPSQNKHVVFDVVGTLVSYDAFFEAVESRMGQRFREHNIGSRLFAYCWMEATEREYTYLSLSGKYIKCFDIFGSIFYRTLWQAGIQNPREFASDDDCDFMLAAYRKLKPREGLDKCLETLRAGGFTVWCLTAGDTERVNGYLQAAGVDFPPENFVSCDTIGIGKPDPKSYQHILDKFPKDDLEVWFAAGHAWDSSAAGQVGFRTAWLSAWEKEPCEDIFGKMEVTGKDLPSVAEGIVAASSK